MAIFANSITGSQPMASSFSSRAVVARLGVPFFRPPVFGVPIGLLIGRFPQHCPIGDWAAEPVLLSNSCCSMSIMFVTASLCDYPYVTKTKVAWTQSDHRSLRRKSRCLAQPVERNQRPQASLRSHHIFRSDSGD